MSAERLLPNETQLLLRMLKTARRRANHAAAAEARAGASASTGASSA